MDSLRSPLSSVIESHNFQDENKDPEEPAMKKRKTTTKRQLPIRKAKGKGKGKVPSKAKPDPTPKNLTLPDHNIIAIINYVLHPTTTNTAPEPDVGYSNLKVPRMYYSSKLAEDTTNKAIRRAQGLAFVSRTFLKHVHHANEASVIEVEHNRGNGSLSCTKHQKSARQQGEYCEKCTELKAQDQKASMAIGGLLMTRGSLERVMSASPEGWKGLMEKA